MELAKSLAPLCRGGVGEEKCDVAEAGGKDGLGAFNVLCLVDQGGKGTVEVEKVLHVDTVWQLLADDAESTGESSAAVELVEKVVSIAVSEGAWIRYGACCNGMFQDAGDKHVKCVKHPA